MRKILNLFVIIFFLVGCSTKMKFEELTDIQLKNISYIYIGWQNLQSVGIKVEQEEIASFYNKINCKYEVKEYKDQKNEQYNKKNSYYIVINTLDSKSFICYYASEKVSFILDDKTYVSTKRIPSLSKYWEIEL